MKYLTRVMNYALMLLLMLSPTSHFAVQQTDDDLLSRPIFNLKAEKMSTLGLLKELAVNYKVPVGFEEATPDNGVESAPEIDINLQRGTVKDVLDIITGVDSKYEWKVIDGVINVYPKIRQNNILDIVVQQFSVNRESKSDISEALTDLPEVKAKLMEMKVRPLQFTIGSLAAEGRSTIVLQVQNVTVRKLLNEIAKQSDSYYWVVFRFGKDNEFMIVRL
jgi:hypothetical protein